jgi:hypothetical protein
MDLEKLTVEIRPRTPWEAVDLGFVVARRWYWRLWYLWLMSAIPLLVLFIIVTSLLPISSAKWSLLLFWLAKPIYEPPLLLWLSKAIFGSKHTFRQTLQEYRKDTTFSRICRILLFRLNPSRSFSMPVLLLEGLTGKTSRERRAILQDGYEPAFLSFASFCIEYILTFTIMSLLYWLIPENLRWLDFGEFIFTADSWIILLAYVVSCSIFAPLYVCSGFMLYISRRVQLEAWDIEIGFKRMRQRLKKRQNGLNHIVTALFLLICFTFASGSFSSAYAQTLDPDGAKKTIEKVLEDKKYGEEITRYHWVPRTKEEIPSDSAWAEAWRKLIEAIAALVKDIAPIIAKYGKFLLLCCAGILLGFLLFKHSQIRRWLNSGLATQQRRQKPEILFGLDLRPESLPEDVTGSCLKLMNSGQKREAMSLLYRCTLSRLINDHNLEISSSYTEKECCNEVQSSRSRAEAVFFDSLTSLWIVTAYGHRDPEQQACYQLVENWQNFYGAKP